MLFKVLIFYLLASNKKSKTFKPRKDIQEGSKQYHLKKYAEATLGSGNLKQAVQLPEGEDLNEWLAVNSKHALFSFWFLLLTCSNFSATKTNQFISVVSRGFL